MLKPNQVEKYFKILVLLCLSTLSFFVLLLFRRESRPEPAPLPAQILKEIEKVDVCGADCQKKIVQEVAKAVATLSATPKKVVTSQTQVIPQGKTAYIPLAGPITSTSTAWVDAPGTDVYLDLANDYGRGAKVTWEASLAVAHGNGQAYARLYDVTHGVAVSGSELSTVNNATAQLVSSGDLNLWAGKNLYRVQIKSLNSFTVTFGSGRIKISY